MTTKTAETIDHAQENAKGWLSSIEEMLEALEGHEEAAKAAGWTGPHTNETGQHFYTDETDGQNWCCGSWKELCEAFDIEAERSEDAEQTIHESVLSVLVRDAWHEPGKAAEDGPDEYEILLSTGGPALRIYGRLDQYGQPSSAELQHQDWGTPWTRFPAPEATLLAFAQCFYFGE